MEFKDGLIGYADCHPWPELGDKPIDEQLSGIRVNNLTSLMQCSLHFARLDAEARVQNRSLLKERSIPSGHYLISDLLVCERDLIDHIISQNYTHVKIKLGKYLAQEVAQLIHLFTDQPLKLRFDFNEKLSQDTFFHFLDAVKELRSSIEFVEDPFSYNPEEWTKCQNQFSIALACDRQSAVARFIPESASFLIVKPAIQSVELFENCPREKLIVTSYLDHPVGQLTAAYVASHIDPHGCNVHGLLSHHVYQSNLFSLELSQQGPKFYAPSGSGFGFDKQLASLHWTHC